MRLLFFGSGSFGLPTLAHLHAHHALVGIITQPDKPAGRKRVLMPTPIGQWAIDHDIPTFKENDVNTPEFVQQVRDLEPDASVVIAFGQKLSPELIDAMGKLAINLHSSLLPKYRGAAPINWAMIHGERVTGVSVIALAQRMDGGEIYATDALNIDPNETAGELHDRLAALGPDAIVRVLNDLENNTLQPIPQDPTQATKAPKLKKTDGTIDFNQPAEKVRARIHGLTPWPGCKVHWHQSNPASNPPPTTHHHPKTPSPERSEGPDSPPENTQQSTPPITLTLLRVHVDTTPIPHTPSAPRPIPGTILDNNRIACNPGTITPLQLQRPGKRAMTLKEFTAGHPLVPGQRMMEIPKT